MQRNADIGFFTKPSSQIATKIPMWIEAITVRTPRTMRPLDILEEVKTLWEQEGAAPRPDIFTGYQNLDVENEISIRLTWEETRQPPGQTTWGVLIARHLERHGLVRHTLWQRSICSTERQV